MIQKHPLNSIKKKNLKQLFAILYSILLSNRTNSPEFTVLSIFSFTFCWILIRNYNSGSGSESRQKFWIHADPDPDPLHWILVWIFTITNLINFVIMSIHCGMFWSILFYHVKHYRMFFIFQFCKYFYLNSWEPVQNYVWKIFQRFLNNTLHCKINKL